MRERKQKYQPYREWYFDGYTRQDVTDPKTGKVRSELVYHGDYYTYQTKNFTGYKILIGALMLLSLACVIGIWVLPSAVSKGWAGIVNLVLIVPLLFLLFCTGHFVFQKLLLTNRQIHAGYYEMCKWVTWNFMLCVVIFLLNLLFFILNRETMDMKLDIWPLVLLAVHIAANRIWNDQLKKKYPVKS